MGNEHQQDTPETLLDAIEKHEKEIKEPIDEKITMKMMTQWLKNQEGRVQKNLQKKKSNNITKKRKKKQLQGQKKRQKVRKTAIKAIKKKKNGFLKKNIRD